MAAPSLDSDHPGRQYLDEALSSVESVLRRGLGLRRCRLWVRSPDGTRYAPITTPGDGSVAAGRTAP